MPAKSEDKFLIGQLAEQAGVKSDTIRFYERSGLLPKPERKASGYRVYDGAALKLVRFIKRAQALGFSLDEIKRILRLRGSGEETCRCVIAMAEATLAETEAKLTDMQSFVDALRKNLARWRKAPTKRAHIVADFCKLIEAHSTP